MSEGKRIRRTPEQIVADLDVQIEKLKDSILELENKKAAAVTEFDNKIASVKEMCIRDRSVARCPHCPLPRAVWPYFRRCR